MTKSHCFGGTSLCRKETLNKSEFPLITARLRNRRGGFLEPVKVGLLGLGTVGGGTVTVLRRNGEAFAQVRGRALSTALPGPGRYRVEVHRNRRLWIATNTLRVGGV